MSEGRIIQVSGSSGSGKTAWTLQYIKKMPRLLAWDPEGEFASQPDIQGIGYKELAALAATGKPGRFAFVPPKGSPDFAFWARCAWLYAQTPGDKTIIADETSDVSHSGKAVGAWGMLIRRGRKYGATLVGITQRPQETDKTLFGNASLIHLCAQWEANDRKYIAERCGVPLGDIESLISDKETGVFEYIEVDRFKKTITRDRLKF